MPQLSSDPLDILIRHNNWATRVILERCRALPRDQFHQDFGIGPGSLHDNLTHSIGLMNHWAGALETKPSPVDEPLGFDERPIPERTPGELLDILERAGRAWLDLLPRLRPRLAEVIEDVFPGSSSPYRFSIAAVVIHIGNHGAHHRAQCLHMLKRLGIDPLPDLEEIEWQHLGEP